MLDDSSSKGQKLSKWYKDHNIETKDQNGQLRGLYDVLGDVAKQWDTLSEDEQKYYLNIQAGIYQTQNLAAILSNFGTAINATRDALHSSGSAAQENEKYMESLEAKVANLKNTFQELSTKVVDSDVVKGVLDLANISLSGLNTDVGGAVTEFGLLTGVLTGAFSIGGKVVGKLAEMGKGAAGVGKTATAFGTLSGTMAALSKNALPVAGLISALIADIGFMKKAIEDADPSKQIEKQISNTEAEISKLQEKIASLQNQGASVGVIGLYTQQVDKLKNSIKDLDTDKLKIFLQKTPSIQHGDFTNKTRAGVTGEMLDNDLLVQKAIDDWYRYSDAVEAAVQAGDFEGAAEAQDKLFSATGKIEGYWNALIELKRRGEEIPPILKSAADELELITGENLEEAAAAAGSLSNQLEGLDSATGYFDLLTESSEAFAQNGKLTLDQIMQLNAAFKDTEGWDGMLERLLSGKVGAEEFADMMNQLGYNTLEAIFSTEGLANASEELMADWLVENGIADSNVTAKEMIANAQQKINENPVDTTQSQQSMEQEGNKATDAADKVSGVTGAQQGVNQSPIITTSSQGALQSLASVAEAVAGRISAAGATIRAALGFTGVSQNEGGWATHNKAQGGEVPETGNYWVGEQGPEIVVLPEGSQVISNKEIKRSVLGGYAQGTSSLYPQGSKMTDIKWGQANKNKDTSGSGSGSGSNKKSSPNNTSNSKSSKSTKTKADNKKKTTAKKATKAVEKETDKVKEQNDAYKEQIDILEHKLFLMEENKASEKEQIDLIRKMQKKAKDEADSYRKQGLKEDDKYIRDLQKEWWNYEKQIRDLQHDSFEKRLKESEEYIDARNDYSDWGADSEIQAWERVLKWMEEWYNQGLIDYEYYLEQRQQANENYIQAQRDSWEKEADNIALALEVVARQAQKEIDLLESQKEKIEQDAQDKIDILEKQNETLEEQITLEEKLKNLANAKKQFSYVYKDGRFQYIQNIDEIAKAETELKAYQREQNLKKEIEAIEESRDRELEAIDDKIKYWQFYVDDYGGAIDKVNELQDQLLAEQILGTKLEGENWEKRLGDLDGYVNRYVELMQKLGNQEWQVGEKENTIVEGPNSTGGRWSVNTAFIPGVGVVPVDIKDGQTQQKSLPVGTVVSTAGGHYKITGTNPDGSYQSVKVDGPGGSSGGGGSSSGGGRVVHEGADGNAPAGTKVGDTVVTAGGNFQVVAPNTAGAKYNPANGLWSKRVDAHANGTLSAEQGISLVGEKGPELRLLGNGDGILPADITRNLWGWGSTSPQAFSANLENKGGVVMQGVTMSFPNVKNENDAQDFMKSVVNLAYQRAYSRS